MLLRFFDISTGFRFTKNLNEFSVHLFRCPWFNTLLSENCHSMYVFIYRLAITENSELLSQGKGNEVYQLTNLSQMETCTVMDHEEVNEDPMDIDDQKQPQQITSSDAVSRYWFNQGRFKRWPTSYYCNSHLENSHLQMGHFETPHFQCSELQRLD